VLPMSDLLLNGLNVGVCASKIGPIFAKNRVTAVEFMIEVPAAEVGKALATIRNKNLFKNHYGGSEEHYQRRWVLVSERAGKSRLSNGWLRPF
jgi:hypothetical protein